MHQLQDLLKQLRCDGTLASIAAQLAVDLNREAEKRATGFHGFREDSSQFQVRLTAQLDPDGRPDGEATKKTVNLLYCGSNLDAAAAWDLAALWRRHRLPLTKTRVLALNFSTDR